MNVRELIERLQDLDPEAEVLLATQPSWPLQFVIGGVATSEDIDMDSECEEHQHYNCADCAAAKTNVVYLVEGGAAEDPYAPRAAWDVAS